MEQIRQVTKTTDGRHIGATFDLCTVTNKLVIGGCEFNVIQILENKIISSNYIIEFTTVTDTDNG